MAYYSMVTNEYKETGISDVTNFGDYKSPYSYLSPTQSIFFQANVPFSLVFTRYETEDENPFRLTMLSPDFSINTTLSRAEFEKVVLNRPLHQHDTYELMYILKGELYQRIENSRHKYVENSCCFINRNVRHAEEYSSSFHSVNLSLSREFLSKLLADGEDNYFQAEKVHLNTDLSNFLKDEFSEETVSQKKYIDFIPQPEVLNIRQYIYALLNQITELTLNPTAGVTLMIKAFIYRIFNFLNSSAYYHTEPISLGTPAESRLFAQITHLMESTNGRISRFELAKQLNYSGNYINRIVKKYTGLNTFEYGTSFTMQKAAWLLANTEQTVSDIITELGFSDRTHFYKLFHTEYGMTPRNYRLQYHG